MLQSSNLVRNEVEHLVCGQLRREIAHLYHERVQRSQPPKPTLGRLDTLLFDQPITSWCHHIARLMIACLVSRAERARVFAGGTIYKRLRISGLIRTNALSSSVSV